MKHNLLKSLIISVILLTGVSNAWAAGIGNLNYVSLTGEFNNWADGSNTAWYFNATDLNNGTANHYTGTFYIPYSNENRYIRLFMGRNNAGNNNWGGSYAFGGYWLNDAEWYHAEMKTDKANDVLVPFSSQPASGYLKLECEFYGTYGIDYVDNPYLKIDQSAVNVLSPTLVANYTTRSGGQTTTLTASCTGGSGGYTYSYKVTCGGNDVTKTTLSATTGSSVIFTAPNANTQKTYTVTVTAKDAHSLLDGLATKTATTNITVTPVFSVNISTTGNGTVNPSGSQQVGSIAVNITATPEIGYSFVNWTATAGITIANPNSASTNITATKAGTVTANFKAQPATTIYLEPTGYWNSHNPQYVAHVWKNSVNEDIIMTGVGDSPYRYYKAEVPYGYTDVVFYRKSTDGTTIWNQTADLQLPTNDNVLYTITSTGTNNSGEQGYQAAGGNWKVANLVYTVTLEATSYGSFQVTCNGETKTEGEIFENVAAGTQLTITNILPKTEGYDQTMVYSTDGANYTYFSDSTEIDGKRTYTYTVNSDVTIAEDFRTTDSRVVYIKVTYKPYWHWCTINNEKDVYPRIIYYNGVNQNRLHNEANLVPFDELLAETNQYNIYGVKIPKGYNSFKLYPGNSFSEYGGPEEVFSYQIIPEDPLKNCFEFKNDENNTGPKPDGEWVSGSVNLKKVADHYDSDGYGHITVQYNNTKYTSKSNEDVTFKTPIGSTITIVESQHEHPETYNGDLIYTDEEGYEHYLNNPVNYPITVWGDINITENFVVRKEATDRDITPNAGVFVFLRIPKRLDQGNVEGDWNYGQWDDNSPHENLGYPIDKFANFVYLKMDVKRGHEVIGSKPEDLGCADAGQEAGHFLMDTAHIQDDQFNTYYCIITDSCWHTVKFERKHADSDAGQGQITCTDIQRFPGGKNNCFTITGRANDGAFIGEWGPAPTCRVRMGFNNIGRYGFKDCYEKIHYRTPSSDEYLEVPCGRIEVLEGEPGNDAYTGTVGLRSIDDKKTNILRRFYDYPEPNGDNYIILTQDTMLDDLFATKNAHVLYVGIPNDNENLSDWHIDNTDDIFVWKRAPYNDNLGLAVKEDKFVIDNITYYKYTLPAGLCNFQIQRKTGNNGTEPICKSRGFAFQIPLTEYNCFMLDGSKDGNEYDGYWTKVPKPNVGDYRVLYAEKELIKTHEEGETEDWETAFRTVYEHPSDIIPKGEASKTISLHITTTRERDGKTVHPMVILQQFQQMKGSNTYKWVNLQAHTVLPLKATGNMGMLPGRKKTFGDLPFYDDGIEAIKNDTTYEYRTDDKGNSYKGSGVWNFTVTQGVSQSSTTVTLDVGNTTRYRGKYYIRTEALTNGWNNYKENLMTYSDYADYNSGFSHYFCKWLLVGNNVKFTIANDYAQSISDPLYGDATDLWGDPINFQMVDRDQVLNEDANVRFAWYEMNNFVHRAYLSGSTHVHDRFLVVKGEANKIFSHYVGEGLPAQGDPLPKGADFTPRYGLDADEEIFRDDANWIYHADIQILPGCTATVTARHYNHEQTFIKERTLVYGKDLDKMTKKYPIRLLYDFKINRLITGYIPNGDNNTDIEAFTTDLMLIRREEPDDKDSKVTQLVFKTKAMDNSNTRAYGVLELSKERLVNDGNYNDLKRRLYWISFPFDVRIADVFGSGIYAQHWIIQSYNGQKRAANGYYYETTESNWEYHFDPNTINEGDSEYQGVLKKGVGYVVALNLYNIWKDGLLDNTKDAICLYFPSKDLISADIVQNQNITINVPYHECTKKGREIADSHWNVIGVPAYKNAGVKFDQPIDLSTDCAYYYHWDKAHNAYTPMASYTGEFSTLHAYMVQYHGGLNWTGVVREGTQSLAARSNTDHQIEHNLRLELQKDGKELDRTFVRLQENEDDVTSGFDFNYDLSKIINAGTNIYTIVKTNDLTTNVSGNVLPLAEAMVIPVGVVIDQAGEYTFSMPDGTAGIIAELIDYQTNTRTNLLLDNYTVTLPAGTNNSRFALSLQPDKTVTSVDNIGNEATGDKVKKYLIDGKLYLQKDGVLYDAQGHTL